MAYASRAGRAKTNPKSPQAHAICDRCGFRVNFVDLRVQYDWRGATLGPIGNILVCDICYDDPQEQLRAITLPADPVPIVNARPELYPQDSIDYIGIFPPTTDPTTGLPVPSQNVLGTVGDQALIIQPIGPNALPSPQGPLQAGIGLDPNAQMPFVIQSHWGTPLAVLSITANGTTIVSVTCSSPHGLSTGNQIAVEGVSNQQAYGFFNVTVTTGTAFTYETNATIKSGSLLTNGTKIITVNAGVPWGMDGVVPKVGI